MSFKGSELQGEPMIVIECVDPRMHATRSNYRSTLEALLGTERSYVVTMAGPDDFCDGGQSEGERDLIERVAARTHRVMEQHGFSPTRIVLVAHTNCAGHDADEAGHREHVAKMAELFDAEMELAVSVEPHVAIRVDDLHWEIQPVRSQQTQVQAA